MKRVFQIIARFWQTWWQPQLQIKHNVTGRCQFFNLHQKSISLGSDGSNDLILFGQDIDAFEGTLIRKAKNLIFLTAQGEKIPVLKDGLQVGCFSIGRVSRIWSLLPLVVALVGLVVLMISAPSKPVVQAERTVVTLPAKGTYGHEIAGQGPTDVLSFAFTTNTPQAMTFYFTPGNIPSSDAVWIELNGQRLESLTPSINTWAREARVALPATYLQPGVNRLEFVTQQPLAMPWGVRNLYVQKSQMEATQVDPEKWFHVAEKLFLERNAISGNLLRAKQAMRKSIKALQQNQQPIPAAYQTLYEKIVGEQKQLFETTLRQARLLVRNQDLPRARRYYQKILQEMIDPMSPNRSKIQREMREAGLR